MPPSPAPLRLHLRKNSLLGGVQWGIQDLPDGAPTSRGGAQPIILKFFCPKTAQTWINLDWKGPSWMRHWVLFCFKNQLHRWWIVNWCWEESQLCIIWRQQALTWDIAHSDNGHAASRGRAGEGREQGPWGRVLYRCVKWEKPAPLSLFSLHIRSMWETICDSLASWSCWKFG